MFTSQEIKRCFVIGPMRDMPRLIGFRDKIVKPILEPLGFEVSTPETGEGSVMRNVLLGLEQADILIADITGSNPNVLYELGIYHSFGKPYLMVYEGLAGVKPDVPFDIGMYRYHNIDFMNPDAAIVILKKLLLEIDGNLGSIKHFDSPVTSFYQSPVTEIPTAVGVFKNYRDNFINMLVPGVFEKDRETGEFREKIREDKRDGEKTFSIEWSKVERAGLTIEIRVPLELKMTTHAYIAKLKDDGKVDFKLASLPGRGGRSFGFNYTTNEKGGKVIVDIPTILSTLNKSIETRRAAPGDSLSQADAKILEIQELKRFAAICENYIAGLGYQDKVKVIRGWTA